MTKLKALKAAVLDNDKRKDAKEYIDVVFAALTITAFVSHKVKQHHQKTKAQVAQAPTAAPAN